MEKRTRTIEVTFEKSEFFVLHRRRKTVSAWCERCGREARMLKPEDAAQASGLSVRKIYQRIEAGTVHFLELPDGSLVVCFDSLAE